MRVPRPVRWSLVLVALALGWVAGAHLQETSAGRDAATAPVTRPAPSGTSPSGAAPGGAGMR